MIKKITKMLKEITEENAFAVVAFILIIVLAMIFFGLVMPKEKADYALTIELDTPE